MPPPSALAEREAFRRFWPVYLGLGVALALAGVAALAVPAFVARFAVLLWGWFLIVRGVVDVVGAFFARHHASFLSHLLMGVFALVIGGLIVTFESRAESADKVESVILLLIAAFLLVGGLAQVVAGLALRSDAWGYTLVSGIIGVVLGVLVWRNVGDPQTTPILLGTFIGLDLLSRGATWVGLGLAARNAPTGNHPSPMP